MLLARQFRKSQQAVEHGQQSSIFLQRRCVAGHFLPQAIKQFVFERDHFFFSLQDLLFVLFQFRRDVAFGIRQRLLANIILRHLREIRIRHFNIITKNFVISNFQ